eukprot:scaffold102392_cov60-Phaeocystis_antarctica.AAC.2
MVALFTSFLPVRAISSKVTTVAASVSGPPESSTTIGGMAPASTMADVFASLPLARSRSATAALLAASDSCPPLNSATSGGIAPASMMAAFSSP